MIIYGVDTHLSNYAAQQFLQFLKLILFNSFIVEHGTQIAHGQWSKEEVEKNST